MLCLTTTEDEPRRSYSKYCTKISSYLRFKLWFLGLRQHPRPKIGAVLLCWHELLQQHDTQEDAWSSRQWGVFFFFVGGNALLWSTKMRTTVYKYYEKQLAPSVTTRTK